jgi:hypothetical protein
MQLKQVKDHHAQTNHGGGLLLADLHAGFCRGANGMPAALLAEHLR